MNKYIKKTIIWLFWIYILFSSMYTYSYSWEIIWYNINFLFNRTNLSNQQNHKLSLKEKFKQTILAKKIKNIDNLTKEEKQQLVKIKIRAIIEAKKIREKQELTQITNSIIVNNNIISEKEELNSLVLESAKEKNIIPYNYDISDKLKYKRIQEKSLSCELAATADISSYLKNQKVSEEYIISVVEKSKYNSLPIEQDDIKIWWNPNKWYVGYIDELPDGTKSAQSSETWYWVLEKPIAKIFNDFWFKTKIITNKNYNHQYNQKQHLTEILETLTKWNMVQLWWDYCTDPDFEDTDNKNTCKYFNSDRKLIWYYEENWELIKHEWLIWEHAFYLLWYIWWVDNPSHIIVWDTMTGKHIYAIEEWIRKWDKMQNRSIIIYK